MTASCKFLAAALAAAFLLPAVAYAQQQRCAPTAQMGIMLMQRFSESIVGRGVVSRERILELYVSPTENRTFTVVVTDAEGKSCILAAGGDWEFAHIQAPGRDL